MLDQNPKIANDLRVRLTAQLLEYNTVRPPAIDVPVAQSPLEKIKDFFGIPIAPYDFSAVPSPRWIHPKDGLPWTYASTAGLIRLEWEGLKDCPYVIEYELGEGDYHLKSEINVQGNILDFGTFSQSYWTTYLVVRNPFKLRVSPARIPRDWSAWTTFRFEP